METNPLQRYNKKMTYTRVHAIFLKIYAIMLRLLRLPELLRDVR